MTRRTGDEIGAAIGRGIGGKTGEIARPLDCSRGPRRYPQALNLPRNHGSPLIEFETKIELVGTSL